MGTTGIILMIVGGLGLLISLAFAASRRGGVHEEHVVDDTEKVS